MQDRKLEAAVLQELLAAGKRGGLGGIELIAGVVLVSEEWTPQNVLFLWGYVNVRAWSLRPRS